MLFSLSACFQRELEDSCLCDLGWYESTLALVFAADLSQASKLQMLVYNVTAVHKRSLEVAKVLSGVDQWCHVGCGPGDRLCLGPRIRTPGGEGGPPDAKTKRRMAWDFRPVTNIFVQNLTLQNEIRLREL